MTANWTAREPDARQFRRELQRLLSRARQRWLLTLACAAGLAAAVVLMNARRPRLHEARVVLSVKESRLDASETPLPPRQLRSYIADAAFNKQVLIAVAEDHGLFQHLAELDPNLVVDAMWDTLDVEVYRNQFIEARYDKLRSARIAISFAALDAEVAKGVLADLTRTLIQFEALNRRAAAGNAVARVEAATEQANAAVDRLSRRLSETRLRQTRGQGRPAELTVEIQRLEKSLVAARERLELVQQARAALQFKSSLEERSMALQFRVIDVKRPQPQRRSPLRMALLGIIAFVLGLVPAAVGVGAFDPRLRTGEDVRRLGVPFLGGVPEFPGCDVGSLRARRDAKTG